MTLVDEHRDTLGIEPTCAALGISRATWYRRKAREQARAKAPAPAPATATSAPVPRKGCPRRIPAPDRQRVLDTLCAEEFMDRSPRAVHAVLLDRGQYLCSVRSMYRILSDSRAVRERRALRSHGTHHAPVLCAARPDQVWTWDITKLPGHLGRWHSLYVVLDVYSRYAVAWLLAERESGALAAQLVRDAALRRGVAAGALTLHADRGAPMTSRPMAHMLAELGIETSHSRPRVSNDNPYSEAQFKTLKHSPMYPTGPGSFQEWHAWCEAFFAWYNREHRHEGIAFHTPEDVYLGRHTAKESLRQATLNAAYDAHPERFVRGRPVVRRAPRDVWINKSHNQALLIQDETAGALRAPAEETTIA